MDPLSLAFAAGATLSYGAYLRQNPSTTSVDTSAQSVPDRSRLNKKKKIWISRPTLGPQPGMRTNNPTMLADKRRVKSAPASWKDNAAYLAWRRGKAYKTEYNIAVPVTGNGAYDDAKEQRRYKREFLPTQSSAVSATLDTYLDGTLATTKRTMNDIASGQTGHTYVTNSEIAPVLVRKLNKAGRFSKMSNYIDDSEYRVSQRGIFMPAPAITKKGASNMYMLKSAAGNGPMYNPTRMAPARYEAPDNIIHGPEGTRIRTRAFNK